MEANRRTETKPERLLRSVLHARGLRFRKDRRINVADRWVRPDIVFGPARLAVFIDGCFWHRCPVHATYPRANAQFWQAKFDRTVTRDRTDDHALKQAEWAVVRIWEHEDPNMAADRVESVVRRRTSQAAVTASRS
jgi:DNA mismatch endonuclease (patch repair protein)